jgi:hypothetical protein
VANKRSLRLKYISAKRRVAKETKIMNNARSRKNYWQTVAENLELRLELIKNGQTEMNFK